MTTTTSAPTPSAMPAHRATLTITVGAPGAGKSTWAHAHAAATGAAVIGRDAIREHLFGTDYLCQTPIRAREERVTSLQRALVAEQLSQGRDVIVDDTNALPGIRASWERFATAQHALFRTRRFNVPLEVALERNARRQRRVPDDVVRDYHRALQRQEEATPR